MIKHDKIKLDLINLIFFVEEMISAHINNHNIQITTLYCLINLIKFIHIITFDDKLIDLYKEDKYLIFFKSFLESCDNSKIIYTNYYINPYEKNTNISKTIAETILDICIKILTSDIIKDNKNIKNIKNYQKEEKLTKNDILDMLYDIFLKEKKK